MSDCERFPKGSRRRSICEGTADDLPLERINAYRRQWDLDPLPDDGTSRPAAVVHRSKPPARKRSYHKPTPCPTCGGKRPRPLHTHGPGTELLKIYADAGVPSCQACKHLARRMDAWGGAGCRERLDEIVEDILPRARKWVAENRPWVHRLLPSAVEDAGIRYKVRQDVLKAIEAAENAKPLRPEPGARYSSRRVETESLAVKTEPVWKTDEAYRQITRDLLARSEIVVKSFARHPVLLSFVQSVRQFYPDLPIRVVDDSFRDGETNAIAEQVKHTPGVFWHTLPYDSGLPAGRNLAVRQSSAEFVIVCDDDFIFTDETDLAALLVPIDQRGLDLCGGLVRMEGRNASNWCGMFRFVEEHEERTLVMELVSTPVETVAGIRFRRAHVTYNFFAARRSVLVEHPWDEQYKITNEHLDSFMSWWQAGLKVAYTVDCICSHSRSQQGEYGRMRRRDHSAKLLKKWQLAGRRTISTTLFPGV